AAPVSLTADRLRTAVADTSTRAVLTSAVQSQLRPVQAWLTRLAKLEMVPFGHLVPDVRLLPQESIRFFHSDTGWIDAAVDGALSVGVGHALDADLNDLAREIRGVSQFVSGVMIRSELVPGWPQTIITAFSKGKEIQPLRKQILGEDLLILLYTDVLDRFTLAEPPQGLHFGLSDNNTTELRSIISPVGKALGDFPRDGSGYQQFLRSGRDDVLDIQKRLAPALAAAHSVSELSSAQFALQMVKAPLLQQFLQDPSASSAQPTEGTL
ncbi:hypothetical protein AB0G02_41900, partial [Actinosynnema sp. NPDC023658]|uniref:hypothetical protein n=1 Tax=Actinosynnema sp. NPDC023658 TaxID=3155465 RepID=UPI0034086197